MSNREYARHGKYGPLYDYLEETEEHTLHFSFEELEEILDAPLPESARTYEVWWNPYWTLSRRGLGSSWMERRPKS
jgi:hypothetical protein